MAKRFLDSDIREQPSAETIRQAAIAVMQLVTVKEACFTTEDIEEAIKLAIERGSK